MIVEKYLRLSPKKDKSHIKARYQRKIKIIQIHIIKINTSIAIINQIIKTKST